MSKKIRDRSHSDADLRSRITIPEKLLPYLQELSGVTRMSTPDVARVSMEIGIVALGGHLSGAPFMRSVGGGPVSGVRQAVESMAQHRVGWSRLVCGPATVAKVALQMHRGAALLDAVGQLMMSGPVDVAGRPVDGHPHFPEGYVFAFEDLVALSRGKGDGKEKNEESDNDVDGGN